MEDLLLKDLKEAGYQGEELQKTKIIDRKTVINRAFDRFLEDAIRGIENEEKL